MIETIAVARMLREAVTTPYLNLVTRPTGVAVRGRIESVLATSEWETAMLDFSDVVLLDLSCADEVVAKLLEKRIIASTSPYKEAYVRLAPSLLNDPAEVDTALKAVREIAGA